MAGETPAKPTRRFNWKIGVGIFAGLLLVTVIFGKKKPITPTTNATPVQTSTPASPRSPWLAFPKLDQYMLGRGDPGELAKLQPTIYSYSAHYVELGHYDAQRRAVPVFYETMVRSSTKHANTYVCACTPSDDSSGWKEDKQIVWIPAQGDLDARHYSLDVQRLVKIGPVVQKQDDFLTSTLVQLQPLGPIRVIDNHTDEELYSTLSQFPQVVPAGSSADQR